MDDGTDADTLGLGELVRNLRVTLALAIALTLTLTLTLAPKVHDDVRVGGLSNRDFR